MSQTVIMNGGESPLASKLKKGDATKAEAFADAGSGNNNGGAAPTFGAAATAKSKDPTPEDVRLAEGSGIARPRSKKS
jgi:hypothetical protein